MMKKYIIIALHFCLLSGTPMAVQAKINFGSPQSAIKISDSGKFHLGQDISNIEGTIKREASGLITGQANTTIEFSQGILHSNNTEIELSASYDPNLGNKTILLQGNDILKAEPGTVAEDIKISGANNKISGQPLFSNPIIFDGNPGTSLIMELHCRLNQDIQLDSGMLTLNHDLELSDGVNITGGGTIRLNNNELAFGSKELNHTDNILWDNANAEYLHGKTNLSAIWTYVGESMLNGNGNILDLSLGGTIFIDTNSTLYLSDITIKGLGIGGLEFANETSRVVMSNVDVELATSYTTTTGGIYVEGPSTFILEDNDWWFDVNGSLSVDGIVLWTDRKGTPTIDRGMVRFGLPKDQYYTSINSGTIKEKVYLSDIESLEILININAGDIAILEDRMDTAEENIENNSHAIVSVHELAVANSNAILSITEERDEFPWDGIITTNKYLCESGHIDPCENITIAADVILNGSGSMIVFSNGDFPQFIVQQGKTVTIEELNFQNINAKTFQLGKCSCLKIGRNVTFGITEDIILDAEKIEIIEGGSLTLYGIGGIRRVGFNSIASCEKCHATRERRPAIPEAKVFNLGNNTLTLKNIELTNIEEIDNHENGIIKLQGSSIINFNQNNARSFIIEGIDNIFRMRQNNLMLNGSLNFGNKEHNILHIVHKIPQGLTEQPQIILGDMFAYVTSQGGIAELIFDDDVIRVINKGYNSFVVDQNSFLGGRQVQIWNYPIRQLSDHFDMADDLILTSNLDSPIERADDFYTPPPSTMGTTIEPDATTPGLIGYQVTPSGQRPLILRSLTGPQMHISNFTIHPTEPLTICINDGTRLDLAPEDVVLKKGDTIYISGKNNVIHVTKTLTLNGSLLFEEGSQLTLEFDKDPAEALKLPEGAQINPEAPIEIRRQK